METHTKPKPPKDEETQEQKTNDVNYNSDEDIINIGEYYPKIYDAPQSTSNEAKVISDFNFHSDHDFTSLLKVNSSLANVKQGGVPKAKLMKIKSLPNAIKKNGFFNLFKQN